MAGNGESTGKCARDGHSKYLPMVLYTRTICCQAGLYPVIGRLCSSPASATSGCVPAAVECSNSPRCRGATGSDHCADADNIRAARPGVLHSVCGWIEEQYSRLGTADL